MNFLVKTSLGILYLFTIISASSEDQLKEKFQQICQTLKCNPSTEICRLDSKCADGNPMDLSQCVHCALKTARPAQTLLASSISEQQQPLAPRLLAKSPGGSRLLASNGNDRSTSTTSPPSKQENRTADEFLYDDYYEYDDDDDDDDDQEDPTGPSEKNKMGEEDDYLDDYAEPIEKVLPNSDAIRKVGVCPKVIQSIEECDPKKEIQSECRFDTDCPSDQKCCESNCGKRVCSKASRVSVSVCPSSFTCSLNCRLGYRTDSNGCLLCQCQSCPSMDQCQKSCPSGFLKDLFGCEICECNEPCPPFPTSCNLVCPPEIGYMKSKDGCPLCQCARSNNIQLTSSCQDDVHCPPGFRCLNDANHVPMCQADLSAAQEVVDPDALPSVVNQCPEDLLKNCNLNCSNGLYLLNENGCPTCACAEQLPSGPKMACPMIKCRANCPNNNYVVDENGCRTCNCASDDEDSVAPQPPVECSRVMCRMFCVHGFRRDENGCEICQCNNEPQPCPPVRCQKACPNGYRKDYSGCQTCQCEEVEVPRQPDVTVDGCSPMKCSLNCKYGFERDPTGCPLCSCNVCPLQTCRMFCMYGFKKNSDGCDICECNWEPVAENIPCSDRVPCTGYRVCNSNLRLCETVSADKVNWFVYNFDVKSDLFRDADFLLAFKRGLINNIAGKYDLEPGQITVTAVDPDSTTSFQIMPYYAESLDEFQKKIDQIDADLGSNEFRGVLPSVASLAKRPSRPSRWNGFLQKHPRMALYLVAVSIGLVALTLAGIFACLFRRTGQYHRTESKVPIYESSYQPAPTDDDPYQHQAVHAPDGTAYVVVESDEMVTSNDKRALV